MQMYLLLGVFAYIVWKSWTQRKCGAILSAIAPCVKNGIASCRIVSKTNCPVSRTRLSSN